MSVSTFSLEVFDFGVSFSSIIYTYMPIIARLNGAIKQMRNPYKYVYRSYIQHSAHIEKNKAETRSAVKEVL